MYLSLIWHSLFLVINWSTDRVALNRVLKVCDSHTHLFSILWRTNSENKSANTRNRGLTRLLKFNRHILAEGLKWCDSKRGFDFCTLVKRPVSPSKVKRPVSPSKVKRPVSPSSLPLMDTGIKKKWKLQRQFSA